MSSVGGEMWGGGIDPRVMRDGGVAVVDYSIQGPRGPKRCPAKFEMKEVEDLNETKKAQRPIYKTVPWVTIFYPGGDTYEGPPTEEHKEMYGDLWSRLELKGNEPGIVGTPLTKVSFINPARARELEYFHVFTVEQLADLLGNDQEIARCGPRTREEATKALSFLKATQDAAFANDILKKLEEATGRIEVLEEENRAFKKQLLEKEDHGKSSKTGRARNDARGGERNGIQGVVQFDGDGHESGDGS